MPNSTNNILIIDGNIYSARKCIEILFTQLKQQFFESITFPHTWPRKGKINSYKINDSCTVYYYYYDVSKKEEENLNQITRYVKKHKINFLWLNAGDYILLTNDNFQVQAENILQSVDLLKILVLKNDFKQISICTYNPNLSDKEIEVKKHNLIEKINSIKRQSLIENKVFFIETSPTFSLYDNEHVAKNEKFKKHHLRNIKSHIQYGELLGYILYDLFLQQDEFKGDFSADKKRYTFFNDVNFPFLHFIKLLNHEFIKDNFKISSVSFSSNYFGELIFLIDIPFKQYYQEFDIKLGNILTEITSSPIMDIDPFTKGKRGHFCFKYQPIIKNDKFYFNYNLTHNIKINNEKIEKYLPFLHSAIFYEPKAFCATESNVQLIKKEANMINDAPDVFYLFTETNFNSIKGIIHFVLLRKDNILQISHNDFINTFWQKYYPIIEPKAEETLMPYLINQIKRNALIAALAAVMSRNMSHNIGSHVLANLLHTPFENDYIIQVLLNYLKNRQEFIADISTASACITFNRYFYRDILSRFLPISDEERKLKNDNYYNKLVKSARKFECYPHLLINNISGKNDIKDINLKINSILINKDTQISIQFNNGEDIIINHDLLISLPNDILGNHAFYIIFENIIRNACKHSEIINDYNTQLKFNIRIDDSTDNYYKISIIDNLGSIKSNRESRCEENFLKNLNKKITDSMVDGRTNKLREGGWGFLEMKICAAYLINYPIIEIDRHNIEIAEEIKLDNNKIYPPLLRVELDEEYNLCISFHFLKPKLAKVFEINDNNSRIVSTLNKDEFKKIGIHTGLMTEYDKMYGTEHEFIVLVGNTSKEIEIDENEINQRVVNINHEELQSITTDYNKTRKFLYSKYIKAESLREPLIAQNGEITSESDDFYNKILFDLHGEWSKKNIRRTSELSYYEPFSNNSLTKSLFIDEYAKATGDLKELMKYEINEAALTEMIVLDERIQNAADEQIVLKIRDDSNPTIERKSKRITVLNSTRVYVPLIPSFKQNSSDQNLISDQQNTSNEDIVDLGKNNIDIDKVLKYINNKINNGNIEYLVIHMGILEKLAGSTEPDVIKKWIIEKKNKQNKYWIDDLSKNFKIIVISGRGLPSNIPTDVFYAPVSLISQYTVSYPSKIMLVKLLKSIRKYRKS